MPNREKNESETPAEKRARALRRRIEGASFAQIGRDLGTTPSQAAKLVRAGMAEALGTDVEELRDFNYLRCEHLIAGFMPSALRGDTDAARTIVMLQSQQAKLMGLERVSAGASGGELKVTIVRPD